MDQPKDFRVENHTFIGYVLVDMPAHPNKMGMMQKPEEGWVPYSQDLRVINALKVHHPDHPERVALYHNDVFVCAVNASFEDILPHFLASRNLFDAPQ